MPLEEYRRKRAFGKTPEPEGAAPPAAAESRRFVVQMHAATRLHYDLRLEVDGVLKSWAVPKGPSLNPADKRLAVMTEDHPLEYAGFEGVIPEGSYGAGEMMVWDAGLYRAEGGSPAGEQIARGELKFSLEGHRLHGKFALVKLKQSVKGADWLLIKDRDAASDAKWTIEAHDRSALTGRTLSEIGEGKPPAERQPDVPGARWAPMPGEAEPLLATLVEKAFSDPDWVYELKWDGIRAVGFVRNGKCELRSRLGRSLTAHYPELAVLAERLAAAEAIVDGEIVALDEQGRSDFEKLQGRMHVMRPTRAQIEAAPATYYLFDLLYCDGWDLRAAPLVERKRQLERILQSGPPVLYSSHVAEQGSELFELARQRGLEGVVGKLARSPYVAGRSTHWVKFKATQEVDAVVAGFTAPQGGREHFGALVLGLYDGETLRYIGGVGSGFSEKTLREIRKDLEGLETPQCPFAAEPPTKELARWVKPVLVARVKMNSWTRERQLRQPVFLGWREDLDPKECRFPEAPAIRRAPAPAAPPAVAGAPVLKGKKAIEAELFGGRAETVILDLDDRRVRLSNLNKVYFPAEKYTKRDLLAYYYMVSAALLPFLRDRPMVLRRYPDGISGGSFFQKDSGDDAPDWMPTFTVPSEEGKQIRYFLANDLAGLLYLTNLGCIDHNPWTSRVGALEQPDYLFFDLDPVEGTPFRTVAEVARELHRILEELELRAFLKTSGATGFHIFLPLKPGYSYEQVRMFTEIVARVAAARLPDQTTLERVVGKRPAGRVFLDFSQNAIGRPLASVYSVRSFPGAPVSAPVSPKELRGELDPARFTLKTMPARLDKIGDLWKNFWKSRQSMEPAIEKLRGGLGTKRRA